MSHLSFDSRCQSERLGYCKSYRTKPDALGQATLWPDQVREERRLVLHSQPFKGEQDPIIVGGAESCGPPLRTLGPLFGIGLKKESR